MIKFLYLLSLALMTMVSATERQLTLVVLGDSIAAGYGVDADEAFPSVLQQKIDGAHLPYRVVNAGVSGDTTAGGLRRISWVLKQPVDVLLIELGGNDGLRGIVPDETARNLQGIIDKARAQYPAVKIAVSGMQMPANMGPEYTRKYREVFEEAAKKNDATFIPFLLEGVGARADLNQADRIHPNPEGHKIVAENVWKVIRPILEERSAKITP